MAVRVLKGSDLFFVGNWLEGGIFFFLDIFIIFKDLWITVG